MPAIIMEDVFHAAQAQLARNQVLAKHNRKREYLFVGGRLRCGRCGRAMTGMAQHGTRYYRCCSQTTFLDASQRCKGTLNADDAEARVWQAVDQVLENPELIAIDVRRQQETADKQRAGLGQELALLEGALIKCEREGQRWGEAYASEIISLDELKRYRTDIDARRQSLLSQCALLQAKLEAIGEAVGPWER